VPVLNVPVLNVPVPPDTDPEIQYSGGGMSAQNHVCYSFSLILRVWNVGYDQSIEKGEQLLADLADEQLLAELSRQRVQKFGHTSVS